MRLIIMLFLVYSSSQTLAQEVTGHVVDENTRRPIMNARVTTNSSNTFTDKTGNFRVNVHFGDSITIRNIGYETYHYLYIRRSKLDTLLIFLHTNTIDVQGVVIKGKRNYRQDSLNRRKEFASVFSYQSPKLKDVFIKKTMDGPVQYSPFQSSTSSIASVNLLSVIGFFTRNKTSTSKLQKKLLKEEEHNYVEHTFSAEKVQSVTPLKGDTLLKFMEKYRPTIDQLKQMSNYQLILYIKKSYSEFTKEVTY